LLRQGPEASRGKVGIEMQKYKKQNLWSRMKRKRKYKAWKDERVVSK